MHCLPEIHQDFRHKFVSIYAHTQAQMITKYAARVSTYGRTACAYGLKMAKGQWNMQHSKVLHNKLNANKTAPD